MLRHTPAGIVVATLLLTACIGEQPDALGPAQPPETTAHHGGVVPARRPIGSLDERMAALARKVPGFAGVYLDQGVATIALVDQTKRELARSVVAEALRHKASGRRNGVHPETFRFVSASYSFLELKTWYDAFVLPLFLDNPAIIATDIDEKRNLIAVGVVSADAVSVFRAAFAAQGIPPDALDITVRSPSVMHTDLKDPTDVIRGGWAIRTGRGGKCTAGINARFAGSSTTYLMTAAHCGYMLALDPGYYAQPADGALTNFGVERAEGAGCNCNGGSPSCVFLYADVALADYSVALTPGFGQIQGVTGLYSTTVDHSQTTTLWGAEYFPWEGEAIERLGKTTGLLYGEIYGVCENNTFTDPWLNDPVETIKVACLVRTNAPGQSGDSGGPFWDVGYFLGINTGSGYFNPASQIDYALSESLVYSN